MRHVNVNAIKMEMRMQIRMRMRQMKKIPEPIGANANAIGLTKDVDGPSQIRSKKIHFSIHIRIRMPHSGCKEF